MTDSEFAGLFYQIILKDIDRADFFLAILLDYVRTNTPVTKTSTIHSAIENVLNKNKVLLTRKKVRISRRFERDLPETMLADEVLEYVLRSLMQCVSTSVPPEGSLKLLTRSFLFLKEATTGRGRYERCIEIVICFTTDEEKTEPPAGKWGVLAAVDEWCRLILRLVEKTVLAHHGIMKFELDREKKETVISVQLPVERRQLVRYKP